MNRIRFCHVIDGANRNPLLYNSIKHSDRRRFRYTVISLEPEGALQEQMRSLGVDSFSLDYTSRSNAFAAFYKLLRYFRREKVQIVQTHLFDSSLIGLSAALAARVPVRIFTGHHSHETPLYKRWLLIFADGASGRFFANRVIAPSEQMKEIFVRDLKVQRDKVVVVSHGFDLEEWRRKAEERSDLRTEYALEKRLIFGTVGRIFWVKNFEELIVGFANATSSRDDAVLLIVGGGDSSRLRETIDHYGLASKVKIVGRREDIAPVMNEFDVYIHASLAESFGMVFIEAAALGKPIVSTPVGVYPEINGDGGIGVPIIDFDRSAIEYGVAQMLNAETEWAVMGTKAQERAQKFNVQGTQAACDELYRIWAEAT